MRTYLVAYDLARPQLNQAYLAEAIMGLGAAWARPLDNVWYLRSTGSDKDIEARLERLLDQNDGLVVQEARGEAAMANTGLRWFRSRRSEWMAEDKAASDHVADGAANLGTLLPFPAARVGTAEMVELEAEAA
jgi:hypothetical protein